MNLSPNVEGAPTLEKEALLKYLMAGKLVVMEKPNFMWNEKYVDLLI